VLDRRERDGAASWEGVRSGLGIVEKDLRRDVSSLADQAVQARFVMRDAKLYAFQFMAS
jgi:hypothetical protein